MIKENNQCRLLFPFANLSESIFYIVFVRFSPISPVANSASTICLFGMAVMSLQIFRDAKIKKMMLQMEITFFS